jgi:hypothetical protein
MSRSVYGGRKRDDDEREWKRLAVVREGSWVAKLVSTLLS